MVKKLILFVLIFMIIVTSSIAPVYAQSTNDALTQETIKVSKYIKTYMEAIANVMVRSSINNESTKTIKILSIGNSFSQDTVYYLHDIAKSVGINIVVGNLYNSGCSLEKHYKYAIKNEKAYTYYKWSTSKLTEKEDYTMKQAILDEKWDYITFQQSSGDSGIYSTYQPYLNNLVEYVKETSSNPSVKFALNMTWAYSFKSTNSEFNRYNKNQKIMYDSIINAYRSAIYDTKIDIIIPSGTAIQNARTNNKLKAVGNDITSDGHHLDVGIGRYIVGLTIFETIIKEEGITKDLYEDVIFIPTTKNNSNELIYLAKEAAENAVKKPFKITSLSNKAYGK